MFLFGWYRQIPGIIFPHLSWCWEKYCKPISLIPSIIWSHVKYIFNLFGCLDMSDVFIYWANILFFIHKFMALGIFVKYICFFYRMNFIQPLLIWDWHYWNSPSLSTFVDVLKLPNDEHKIITKAISETIADKNISNILNINGHWLVVY